MASLQLGKLQRPTSDKPESNTPTSKRKKKTWVLHRTVPEVVGKRNDEFCHTWTQIWKFGVFVFDNDGTVGVKLMWEIEGVVVI